MDAEKEKQLGLAVSQIEKAYGKGAVMRLGDHAVRLTVEAIPTGSLALDIALGVGGFPRGRVVELFGPEGSGKTTVALHVIAEAQKKGGIAAFIDAEHALDPNYAKNLGVDIDSLLVSQPDTGEQALEIADMLIRSGAIDVLTVDSVAALVPRAEIEGEMGDAHVGLQARLMSQALRKLTASVAKSRTCVIFINQIREKIGVMFGNPEVTPGGRALKFYSSVRLDVRRIEGIKDGAEFIGNRVRAKVVKNKCVAEGTLVFDPSTGLTHRIEEIVDGGQGTMVHAIDKLGKLHVRPIISRFDQGEQDVIGLAFRGGTTLWVTPDHKVMTERGWVGAGDLEKGSYVARPRRAGRFGNEEPVSPDCARLLGYLIGDGYVGGKTPIAFINTQPDLKEDAARIAQGLGCEVNTKNDGIYTTFSHRPGEKNGVMELARWAEIWGHLAWEKKIPAVFFSDAVSEDVIANLLFGIWESDGWISREQHGGIRVGFVTTSEQLAQQIRWLLLRWGIGSSVGVHEPGSRRSVINGRRVESRRPCWQVRVSGIDNVTLFGEALPSWGPRGQILHRELARPELKKHRGSRLSYLPPSATEPILAYVRETGLKTSEAAGMVGFAGAVAGAGIRTVLGPSRLRRDRVAKLAEALDSEFLRCVLDEDVYYERVWEVLPARRARTFDIEVDELHSFVAEHVVVHNCAPPFRTAEFDLMYSRGISKEGSILDVAVEQGVVQKSGAWYTYNEEQIGQGRENAKAFLSEHTDVAAEIERLVKAQLMPTPGSDAPPPDEPPPAPEETGENGESAENLESIDKIVADMTAKAGARKK